MSVLSEILCSYPNKLKLCTIVDYIKSTVNIPLFFTFPHIKWETVDMVPDLTMNVPFLADTV